MTNIRNPRHYWNGLSDDQLRQARNEWIELGTDVPWLAEKVAEVDDELVRRAEYRARFTGGDAA